MAERGGSVVNAGVVALSLIVSCVCCCDVPTFSVAGRGRGWGRGQGMRVGAQAGDLDGGALWGDELADWLLTHAIQMGFTFSILPLPLEEGEHLVEDGAGAHSSLPDDTIKAHF